MRRLWNAGWTVRAALLVLLLVAVVGVLGPLLAPHDPLAQDTDAALQGPSPAHLLGTDYIGRDVLSRLLAGAPLSLLAALLATTIGLVLGVLPGVLSVFAAKPWEWLSLRLTDALLALPFILFAIVFAGLLGNGLWQAMIAIGILFAPGFFRVSRASALSTASSQYIEAATLLGASSTWLVAHTPVAQRRTDRRRRGDRRAGWCAAGGVVSDFPRHRGGPSDADLGWHARQ